MIGGIVLLLMAGELPLVESKQFDKDVQQALLTATVRVLNKEQKREGSGVIVRQHGAFVYILTAQHLVDKADAVDIATFSAKSYPKVDKVFAAAQVAARSKDADLALLRLATRDTMPGVLRIFPPDQAGPEKDFAVLSCGLETDKPATCLEATVLGKKLIRKPDGASCHVWELNRGSSPGRSGGPLVDKRGMLLGIASGQNNDRGYYSHIGEIYRFLKENKQSALLEAPKD